MSTLFYKLKQKTLLFKSLLFLCACLILFILFTPVWLAYTSRPNPTQKNYPYASSFTTNYDVIRQNFAQHIYRLKADGYPVKHDIYSVSVDEDLVIDVLTLDASHTKDNLIILTTGVHGIEGYIGSVMVDVFMDTFFPQLDLSTTGLMIVSNVNPYGVKYGRRYNENNVDLNRNFIYDWSNFDLNHNTSYPKVKRFLQPQSPLTHMGIHELAFLGGLAKEVVTEGIDTLTSALLEGQFQAPEGVYYGGTQDEASTRIVKDLFKTTLASEYTNLVHLDLHSGYGPRYAMTIFNSAYEPMTEQETIQLFDYPQVIAYDSEDFYPTTGDITEYFYKLKEATAPHKALYATCFEFGTLGDDFLNGVRSMKYTIDENRNHFYPSSSRLTNTIIAQRYMEMFFPSEPKWREKAVADFIQATTGVLQNKLY